MKPSRILLVVLSGDPTNQGSFDGAAVGHPGCLAHADLHILGCLLILLTMLFVLLKKTRRKMCGEKVEIDDGSVVVRRRPARPKEGVRSEMMKGVHGAGIRE